MGDSPVVFGTVDLNIGDGYDEFTGKNDYTMMGRISIVFIEVIFAINPLLKVYCLVPLTPGHTLYKIFITVRVCVHAV